MHRNTNRLIPDPLGSRLCLNTSYPMDQGSVLWITKTAQSERCDATRG